MIDISLSPQLQQILNSYQIVCIQAKVVNTLENKLLWEEIAAYSANLVFSYSFEAFKKHEAVLAARQAFRLLGKDPSRYRVSSEALVKRILDKKELYRINTVVDVINYLSLKSFHSIGLFDLAKLQPPIEIRTGIAGDTYDSHGKADMNLANIPVFCDAIGPFGSPVSDSRRSMVTPETTDIVMTINIFEGSVSQSEIDDAVALLQKYGAASELEIKVLN